MSKFTIPDDIDIEHENYKLSTANEQFLALEGIVEREKFISDLGNKFYFTCEEEINLWRSYFKEILYVPHLESNKALILKKFLYAIAFEQMKKKKKTQAEIDVHNAKIDDFKAKGDKKAACEEILKSLEKDNFLGEEDDLRSFLEEMEWNSKE